MSIVRSALLLTVTGLYSTSRAQSSNNVACLRNVHSQGGAQLLQQRYSVEKPKVVPEQTHTKQSEPQDAKSSPRHRLTSKSAPKKAAKTATSNRSSLQKATSNRSSSPKVGGKQALKRRTASGRAHQSPQKATNKTASAPKRAATLSSKAAVVQNATARSKGAAKAGKANSKNHSKVQQHKKKQGASDQGANATSKRADQATANDVIFHRLAAFTGVLGEAKHALEAGTAKIRAAALGEELVEAQGEEQDEPSEKAGVKNGQRSSTKPAKDSKKGRLKKDVSLVKGGGDGSRESSSFLQTTAFWSLLGFGGFAAACSVIYKEWCIASRQQHDDMKMAFGSGSNMATAEPPQQTAYSRGLQNGNSPASSSGLNGGDGGFDTTSTTPGGFDSTSTKSLLANGEVDSTTSAHESEAQGAQTLTAEPLPPESSTGPEISPDHKEKKRKEGKVKKEKKDQQGMKRLSQPASTDMPAALLGDFKIPRV